MGTAAKVEQSVILFDGVCNLCNGSVNFIIDRDGGHFKFASLQSDEAQTLLSRRNLSDNQLESIVLVEPSAVYYKSDAALRIAGKLSGLWPVMKVFIILPRGLRDFFYDIIAKNRYKWFGKRDSCRMPTPELRDRFLDS
ncbi:thiol-disulfide oxidoreductase DCC family protein [Marinoscillum sp.]|uniref:thiol-disulfide oxidoreductase DCC family protein n=1 Tax=Marinoscillum sp. TaxID=2024838 RepID=UPI003BADB346